MIRNNYHTHCYLCDHAEGLPSDYIKYAVQQGMKEIGISDHGPIPNPELTRRMTLDEFYNIYLKDIQQAKRIYKDHIIIYTGVELEYFPEFHAFYDLLMKDLDYMILGQHDIVVDGKNHDIYQYMTPKIINIYAETVVKALKTGYFRVLAHPEIFMFQYPEWDESAKKCAKQIIEACIETGVLIELNVAGARRGYMPTKDGRRTWIYPRLEFWELAATYKGLKVIINEDAHRVIHMNDHTTQAVVDFAKSLKLDVVDQLFEVNDHD